MHWETLSLGGLLLCCRFVVGGGTFFDACYVAIKQSPNNVNCIDMMTEGINNTLIFEADALADDDITFIKRVHNLFHDGQGETLPEIIRFVADAEADWLAHRTTEGITTTNTPTNGPYSYENQFKSRVLTKWKSTWSKWDHFDHTKVVYNHLTKIGKLDEFLNHVETNCDMESADSIWAINHLHHLKIVLCKDHFVQTIEPSMLATVYPTSMTR